MKRGAGREGEKGSKSGACLAAWTKRVRGCTIRGVRKDFLELKELLNCWRVWS